MSGNQEYKDMLEYRYWRTKKMGEYWKALAMMGGSSQVTIEQMDTMFSEEMWRREVGSRGF